MSWLTAPRWQMIWGCFRSFALLRIRVLPDLMMDTHRCIAIGRNCLPFRITRVHFRLFGSLCCSCAFVIFCVISVGCCWFVSVLSWFVFCSRLLFVDNFWSQLATIWHFWLAPKLQHLLVNVLRTLLTYLVSFKYSDSWEVLFCVRQISLEGQFFFQKMHRQKNATHVVNG